MAKWQGNRFVSGRSRVRSPLQAFFFVVWCQQQVMKDNVAEWLRR